MRLHGYFGSLQRYSQNGNYLLSRQYEIWDGMDIRNILSDSMPHLILPDITRHLGYQEGGKIFRLIERLYLENDTKVTY